MTRAAPRRAASIGFAALAAALLCAGCDPGAEPAAPQDRPPLVRDDADDAPAEAADRTETFETFSDPERGLSFRYPRELGTTYLRPVEWPPAVAIDPATTGPATIDGATIDAGRLACTDTGNEITERGRTEPRTIGGRSYCVTLRSEGAAGSIYTTYEYAFAAASRVAVLSFVLRAVQCANYDEPQRRECEAERVAFDVDALADGIARTLELQR